MMDPQIYAALLTHDTTKQTMMNFQRICDVEPDALQKAQVSVDLVLRLCTQFERAIDAYLAAVATAQTLGIEIHTVTDVAPFHAQIAQLRATFAPQTPESLS